MLLWYHWALDEPIQASYLIILSRQKSIHTLQRLSPRLWQESCPLMWSG